MPVFFVLNGIVCGRHRLPEGRSDHQFVDVADALLHMGLDSAVDPVRRHLQVRPCRTRPCHSTILTTISVPFQQLLADDSGGRRLRWHGPDPVLVARLLAGPVPHSGGHAARGRADQSVSAPCAFRNGRQSALTLRWRIPQIVVPHFE